MEIALFLVMLSISVFIASKATTGSLRFPVTVAAELFDGLGKLIKVSSINQSSNTDPQLVAGTQLYVNVIEVTFEYVNNVVI